MGGPTAQVTLKKRTKDEQILCKCAFSRNKANWPFRINRSSRNKANLRCIQSARMGIFTPRRPQWPGVSSQLPEAETRSRNYLSLTANLSGTGVICLTWALPCAVIPAQANRVIAVIRAVGATLVQDARLLLPARLPVSSSAAMLTLVKDGSRLKLTAPVICARIKFVNILGRRRSLGLACA